MNRETPEQLAAAIAADPHESALLSRIPVAVAVPPPHRSFHTTVAEIEMRRLLDLDPELVRVANEVLRSRDRSEYFVRLRARAVRILHPHFNDVLVGRFLRRSHSAIKFIRRTRP